MSLVASSSSFPSRKYKFNVFSSFHGPDVRKTFLSHMRKQFNYNGITMFDDQGIERSEEIAPSLKQAIKDSRISIVILSKKYASSSWCLNELVDILKCKRALGQIVMTIFYGVAPSDVWKHTGEFGTTFNETCVRKTDKERQKWSKALKDVGHIAGENFLRWDDEAKMIEKIAKDVSDKLNATPSREIDGMVDVKAHLREMESLLDLDFDGVKMVAITGPAGIGKTTIARALQSRVISSRFQLTCFVDSLRGSYLSGLDELRLQEQFLSKVLNQSALRISHSGVIGERLCRQRVLIILDDVNDIKQLEALANETTWFGPGSRIVVTTENKELLQQHGITDTYHVSFPCDEQALKILCSYAFRKDFMPHGFRELAKRVTKLCSNLPLGLRVVGSSLRGKNEKEWEKEICSLENDLPRDIEDVLRIGYESLYENEQSLFLHISVFFNYKDDEFVEAMFADNNLDIKHSLKSLANKSLINISMYGKIVMHKLLQQVGIKALHKGEPWKLKILVDAPEICDILESATGTRAVSGISFDICDISDVSISERAFKRMANLRFLKVYRSRDNGNYRMHIPEEMEFPRHLRLLDWEAYPSKSLPQNFQPEYIVELNMQNSELEKLWRGAHCLSKLKCLNLSGSFNLKELPDLSGASRLEILRLCDCKSLVEIPSSFLHLHKLRELVMDDCINLQVIPAHMNLASLQLVYLRGCSRLRDIPLISTNIQFMFLSGTAVEDMPPSCRFWSRLDYLDIQGKGKFNEITYLPTNVTFLNLMNSDVASIPDCIKDLHRLEVLLLDGCRRLTSLPELPHSLKSLIANNCESLETVCYPLNTPNATLRFVNCFKLGQEAQRTIIQRPLHDGTTTTTTTHLPKKTLLPGGVVPAEFYHRGKGNILTIPPNGNVFLVCVVISRKEKNIVPKNRDIWWLRILAKNSLLPHVVPFIVEDNVFEFQTEHLLIFICRFPHRISEIAYEFSSSLIGIDIIACGAKWFKDKSILRINKYESDQVSDNESIEGSYEYGSDQVSEIIEARSYESGSDQVSDYGNTEGSYNSGSDQVSEIIEGNYESGSDQVFEIIQGLYEPGLVQVLGFERSKKAFVEETNISAFTVTDGVICDSPNKEYKIINGGKHIDCWSWIFILFDLSNFVRYISSLVLERRR